MSRRPKRAKTRVVCGFTRGSGGAPRGLKLHRVLDPYPVEETACAMLTPEERAADALWRLTEGERGSPAANLPPRALCGERVCEVYVEAAKRMLSDQCAACWNVKDPAQARSER